MQFVGWSSNGNEVETEIKSLEMLRERKTYQFN
jgi:hypothetical protein